MAGKVPIDREALRKKGIFNENRFYQLISAEADYIDPELAKTFYLAMMRVVTQELKKNGVARLPYMGDFALVKQKDRLGLAGRFQRMIIGKYVLKFYAQEGWRRYFNKYEGQSGREGELDPRQKILGQTLE